MKSKDTPHWYVLRATYGRERQACDYMSAHGIGVFHPTISTVKIVDGKRRTVTESRLPNIFFAHGTEEQMKRYVYDNVNLPYLRFYYRHAHAHSGGKAVKEPLTVPDRQMESLRIVCQADAEDTIVSSAGLRKFEEGTPVRVTAGPFKGFEGRVARYKGQQRVGIVIDGIATACTSYVPSALLERIL